MIIFTVVGFIVTPPHVPFGSRSDAPDAILHRLTPKGEANTFTTQGIIRLYDTSQSKRTKNKAKSLPVQLILEWYFYILMVPLIVHG